MNILRSILSYRCPRCRSTKIFREPFELTNPLNMHEKCSSCNQPFEPEPRFYYGAMFISYGLGVFYILVPALILTLGMGWTVNKAITIESLAKAEREPQTQKGQTINHLTFT